VLKLPVARRPWLLPLLLATLVTASALVCRPLLPVDETRYLAVAWEMHNSGDYLVPHLNGQAYSHKPPVLFWLVNLAWSITGVAGWSARLIGPIFGAAGLVLASRLARRLWPERTGVEAAAPLVLGAMLLWAVFASATMFEALLAFFVLLAAQGLWTAAEGHSRTGWILVGLALGGGILSKGPVVLVHVLPLAALAPWWSQRIRQGRWRRWYAALLMACLGGVAIGLAWAIPAALVGPAEYRGELLWGQTVDRAIESFAHRHPWWWYLPLLPIVMLPWSLWPPLWKAVRRVPLDEGARYCLAWAGGALLFLSLVSGKQPYYLVPALPAVALWIAWLATSGNVAIARGGRIIVAVGFLAWGIGLALLPWLTPWTRLDASPAWAVPAGLAIAAGAFAILAARCESGVSVIRALAVTGALSLCAMQFGLRGRFWEGFDVEPFAQRIAALQEHNVPLAHLRKYHGQFHFAGRLTRPIEVVDAGQEAEDWARAHPDGLIICYGGGQRPDQARWVATYMKGLRPIWVALNPTTSPTAPRIADQGRGERARR